MNAYDIDNVAPNLYLSSRGVSEIPQVLDFYKIKAIITVETETKSTALIDYYRSKGIDYMQIFIYDIPSENILTFFNPTYDFIKSHISQGQNVLVHCRAGVSRSATIVLNYIIRRAFENGEIGKGGTAEQIINSAIDYVRQKRPVISPNYGFLQQLEFAIQKYIKKYLL